ncbi:sugar transferase [Arcticibacter sp.]|jgi:lipopolysaccharide/colanic/teichoic acid biosynthesis glycosyltransferase|uniref:sugar transferase n=1 Tax=Arcticibacter sp. TaxID=1872630 RepID=UPI0038901A11
MLKRAFDISLSVIGLIVLSPVFIVVSLCVLLDSKGPVFYKQTRVGLNNKDFSLYKFRTMFKGSEKSGLLTISNIDTRITSCGYWLRKYKMDELPQLLNVLTGDMSLVGPRPEVRKYVDLYDKRQCSILSVKPGITDWASIQFHNESEILATSDDPEHFYINTIIPLKIEQNLKYINDNNFWVDLKIIAITLFKVVRK